MTIVEIAWFKSTKAYQEDHTLLYETARRLKEFSGLNKLYLGWQIEPDPTIAYVLNVWESYDHYIAAGKEKEYSETFATFQPALDGTYADISVAMIPFTSGPEEAVGAPVTEIVLANLKDGKEDENMTALFDAIGSTGKLSGHHWGRVRDKENQVALLVGWKSVEFHYEVAKTDIFLDVIKLGEETLLRPSVAHVAFKEM
ncbi:hypothetical protein HYPSUDRAFT_58058 [Hypholoma sublateritium FD-334 SS-4]|uniref:ABM domain-containing protein n=1 Tax=Hypholoma sublateritium (strain FD-334 SS-4) TaxID=945553 RepID=A0A0D2M0I0_HYPSF|nr:hypothetical protein HYPSUDRAFT_58058 [Hypholoma sublateritium FD-334 SS-4]